MALPRHSGWPAGGALADARADRTRSGHRGVLFRRHVVPDAWVPGRLLHALLIRVRPLGLPLKFGVGRIGGCISGGGSQTFRHADAVVRKRGGPAACAGRVDLATEQDVSEPRDALANDTRP